jgi:hypothetical protein
MHNPIFMTVPKKMGVTSMGFLFLVEIVDDIFVSIVRMQKNRMT